MHDHFTFSDDDSFESEFFASQLMLASQEKADMGVHRSHVTQSHTNHDKVVEQK